MVLGESCVLPSCQLPCRVYKVSGLLWLILAQAGSVLFIWCQGDTWWEVGCAQGQHMFWER